MYSPGGGIRQAQAHTSTGKDISTGRNQVVRREASWAAVVVVVVRDVNVTLEAPMRLDDDIAKEGRELRKRIILSCVVGQQVFG